MMLECSIGELLAKVTFMHHDDKGHTASKQYGVLKWIVCSIEIEREGFGVEELLRAALCQSPCSY